MATLPLVTNGLYFRKICTRYSIFGLERDVQEVQREECAEATAIKELEAHISGAGEEVATEPTSVISAGIRRSHGYNLDNGYCGYNPCMQLQQRQQEIDTAQKAVAEQETRKLAQQAHELQLKKLKAKSAERERKRRTRWFDCGGFVR